MNSTYNKSSQRMEAQYYGKHTSASCMHEALSTFMTVSEIYVLTVTVTDVGATYRESTNGIDT